MGILDDFKKLSEESTICEDADVQRKVDELKAQMLEYDKNGTVNGKNVDIKDVTDDFELEIGNDTGNPFLRGYKYVSDEELNTVIEGGYQPKIIRAYCPTCGEEIICTKPTMYNIMTGETCQSYICECGEHLSFKNSYPRLVMVKDGVITEVFTK